MKKYSASSGFLLALEVYGVDSVRCDGDDGIDGNASDTSGGGDHDDGDGDVDVVIYDNDDGSAMYNDFCDLLYPFIQIQM